MTGSNTVQPLSSPSSIGTASTFAILTTAFVAVTTTFFVISLLSYCARLYIRVRILKRVWWDDWTLSGAVVCSFSGCVLQFVLVRYGYGLRPNSVRLLSLVTIVKMMIAIQVLCATSVTLVKISLCLMLLRIVQSHTWKLGLYVFIAFQAANGMAGILLNFVECRPFQATWNPSLHGAKCVSGLQWRTVIMVVSLLFIASDLVIALSPIKLIYRIHRPLWEKILLIILMGLGLLASTAGALKLYYICKAGGVDAREAAIKALLWEKLEEYLGILAACIPTMKAPFERFLNRLGLISTISLHPPSGQNENWGPRCNSIKLETQPAKDRTPVNSDVNLIIQITKSSGTS